LVHVTGGGFYENIPRVMPDGLGVSIDLSTWDVPPIFTMLARLGDLSQRDMYTTFNMGIGMIAVVDETDAKGFTQNVEGAVVIGRVTNHTGVELR
jgi:phosphoribosylformylglycinamidine cyclo-ligase